jgi:hypothetical protein
MTGAVPPGGSEGQHPTSGQRPSTSDKRICDLHRRTIADMTIRTFSDKTRRRIYPPYRSRFQRSRSLPRRCNRRRRSTHPGRAGRAAAEDELQASALPLFFTVPLGRTDLTHQVARTRYPRKLPRVLTADLSFRVVFTLTSAIGDIRAGARQRWQSGPTSCRPSARSSSCSGTRCSRRLRRLARQGSCNGSASMHIWRMARHWRHASPRSKRSSAPSIPSARFKRQGRACLSVTQYTVLPLKPPLEAEATAWHPALWPLPISTRTGSRLDSTSLSSQHDDDLTTAQSGAVGDAGAPELPSAIVDPGDPGGS